MENPIAQKTFFTWSSFVRTAYWARLMLGCERKWAEEKYFRLHIVFVSYSGEIRAIVRNWLFANLGKLPC